jgi:hypothetical protein
MPRSRNLLDSLPKRTPPPHDVENFCLVSVDLHRTGVQKVRRRHQIQKLSLHVFSLVVVPSIDLKLNQTRCHPERSRRAQRLARIVEGFQQGQMRRCAPPNLRVP